MLVGTFWLQRFKNDLFISCCILIKGDLITNSLTLYNVYRTIRSTSLLLLIHIKKYFPAIHNYKSTSEQTLDLTVGDAVHLLLEHDDWYFGYVINDRTAQGIFPKGYVHVKECEVDDSGPTPVFLFRHQPPIVQEITTVLREWGIHWKNLYVVSEEVFLIFIRVVLCVLVRLVINGLSRSF